MKINKNIFSKINFSRHLIVPPSASSLICVENNEKKVGNCEYCKNDNVKIYKELQNRDIIKIEMPKNIFVDEKNKKMVGRVLTGKGAQYSTEDLKQLVRLIEEELMINYEHGFVDLDRKSVFKAIEILGKTALLVDKFAVSKLAEGVLNKLHEKMFSDNDYFRAIEEVIKNISEDRKKRAIDGIFSCPGLDDLNAEVFRKLYANKLEKVSADEGKRFLKFIFDNFMKLSNELTDMDKGIFFVITGRLISHEDIGVRDSAEQFIGRYASAFFRGSDY